MHCDPKQQAQVTGNKGTHRAGLSPGFATHRLGGSAWSTNLSLVSSDGLNRADSARLLRARQEGGVWTPSTVLDAATALV